jgi:hypothetical protein
MKRDFINPFTKSGKWYKGNIHTHSTFSDGTKTVEELVKLYKKAGYDFLSITDHGKVVDVLHLTKENFLMIPGEEICIGTSNSLTPYHIVALGIEKTLPFKDFDYALDPQRVIEKINHLGGLAILAHPYWSGLNHSDMMKIGNYHGVEIYNTSCDYERNTGSSEVHIDGLIAAGQTPLLYASDDHHGAEGGNAPLDACVAWISVKAKSLTFENIMNSIDNGHFYSSNGPEIKSISINKDGVINLECSPVKYISFISTPSLGLKFHAMEKPLTKASYPGRKGERYIRIEIQDFDGKKAWSNPIYNKG